MKFISTRGGKPVSGATAILKGLASGGGLFVPETFPSVTKEELEGMAEMSYPERATEIVAKFLTDFDKADMLKNFEAAYSKFDRGDPAPLLKIKEGTYILELFHGPTCAFKDIALAVMPYLMKKSLDKLGVKEKVLVLVATSGDTGKAAMEGFKDSEVKIMTFYPADGVSKMQKLQMSTQEGENVNVVAVKGNFDDCQTAVKEIFADAEFAEELKEKGYILSSANSINFGRLVPQVAYYFSAYIDLVTSGQITYGEEIDFAVPTGNFGNILAGYYAKRMGLPVRRLHCASNENNILTDFLSTGKYDTHRELIKTTSPSMDILVSSNLERLIFEVSGRDAKLTASRMEKLKSAGEYTITDKEREEIAEIFDGGFADENDLVETIYELFEDTGYTMDTHTGCALKVTDDFKHKNKKDETKTVILSTANPYKFPQDVLYAVTGNDVKDSFKGIKRLHAATAMAVPKCLKELRDKPIRFTKTVNKTKLKEEVREFIK